MIKIALAALPLLFIGHASFAADLPDWNIQLWCEKAADKVMVCVEKEKAAKERLAKRDDAQDLINMLAPEISPGEQSYVLFEAVVNSLRKN